MFKIDKTTGFIGAGNMGEAFVGALIKSDIIQPSKIYMSDINQERLDALSDKYGINVTTDNMTIFNNCDVIILAVKPQIVDSVLSSITQSSLYDISTRKLIISIIAGFTIKNIEDHFYANLDQQKVKNLPIVRVMPNTPCLILEGMSGMSVNKNAIDEDIKIAKTILESMGKVIEFDETYLDAVTALSGSGPAYAFYLVESMIKAGIELGLNSEDAFLMTLQTVKGAIKLIESSKESPEALRKKVTSPGGTTQAAITYMENNNVKDNIIKAIKAACDRSKELGK